MLPVQLNPIASAQNAQTNPMAAPPSGPAPVCFCGNDGCNSNHTSDTRFAGQPDQFSKVADTLQADQQASWAGEAEAGKTLGMLRQLQDKIREEYARVLTLGRQHGSLSQADAVSHLKDTPLAAEMLHIGPMDLTAEDTLALGEQVRSALAAAQADLLALNQRD